MVVRRRWCTRPVALSALLMGLAMASCAENVPMDSLDPAGPAARQIDGLFRPVFWTAVGMFVLVQGLILVAVIVFRDRPGRKEPRQVHGHTKLEVTWTLIPALILAAVAVPTTRSIFDLTRCEADALPVRLIGHQWWFEYYYPDFEVTTANVLVIPAGRQACLTMTSEDVLHNYWVPRLNGKRYLVPGQDTLLTMEADEPGEYWGQCGEFCGLSHAKMRARVVALTEADFDAWVADQQAPAAEPEEGSLAAKGKEVFLGGQCTQCHVIREVNVIPDAIGPELTHFASRHVFAGATLDTNPENLKAWLANPPEVKPGSFMPDLNLAEDDIDALIAYLESLR